MKIQKQTAYRYKDKTYYKHVVIIPQDTIRELGWEAENLDINIEDNRLILERKVVKSEHSHNLKNIYRSERMRE